MYEIYCKLRDEKNFKDADVVRATGITKSTFSDWKNGRSCPKNEKLQKIADFFDVDIDYLCGRTDIRKKVHFKNDSTEHISVASDPDVRRIERARKKMPEADKKFMMDMLERSFSEYFKDDGLDDPD